VTFADRKTADTEFLGQHRLIEEVTQPIGGAFLTRNRIGAMTYELVNRNVARRRHCPIAAMTCINLLTPYFVRPQS
jgi:hypothetical protein